MQKNTMSHSNRYNNYRALKLSWSTCTEPTSASSLWVRVFIYHKFHHLHHYTVIPPLWIKPISAWHVETKMRTYLERLLIINMLQGTYILTSDPRYFRNALPYQFYQPQKLNCKNKTRNLSFSKWNQRPTILRTKKSNLTVWTGCVRCWILFL
jgi:hypothetical protein